MDLELHLANLGRLLDLERDEEKLRYEQSQAGLSLAARAARGSALLDLKVSDSRSLGGRVLLELVPSRSGEEIPSSLIGSGSIVQVVPRRGGVEGDEELPSGVVSRLSRARLSIAFDAPPPEWLEEGKLALLLRPNAVTYERQRAGLRRLATREDGQLRRWRAVLSGAASPAVEPSLPFEPSPRLNLEQNEALALALAAKDLALIHGPPGTGKTTVLAEVIARSVERGERVLVAAASNLAVDNLLERLANEGLRMLRLGHVARVSEPLLPWTLDEQIEAHAHRGVTRQMLDEAHALLSRSRKLAARGRAADRYAQSHQARREAGRLFAEAREAMRDLRAQLVDSAQVIFATCTGSEVELLSGTVFDLAVVDEATQAVEPAALLPVLRARRAVLAGDHRQLPPTVLSSQAAREGLGLSLFERMLALHGASVSRMLREQYRMHARIMEFPSRELYEGALRAHPSVAERRLSDLPGVTPALSARGPIEFLDTAGKGFEDELPEESESRRNPQEADLVAAEVRALIAGGLAPRQIAVIAPYDAQVQTLRALLPLPELEIDTVDGFQGRENEAVVVSLTRSNAAAEVGFLADIRRMNVAITRARRLLLVVGDSATVSAHPFYRDFIDYVTQAGGYRSAWDQP